VSRRLPALGVTIVSGIPTTPRRADPPVLPGHRRSGMLTEQEPIGLSIANLRSLWPHQYCPYDFPQASAMVHLWENATRRTGVWTLRGWVFVRDWTCVRTRVRPGWGGREQGASTVRAATSRGRVRGPLVAWAGAGGVVGFLRARRIRGGPARNGLGKSASTRDSPANGRNGSSNAFRPPKSLFNSLNRSKKLRS
jgi:hypothetical protein